MPKKVQKQRRDPGEYQIMAMPKYKTKCKKCNKYKFIGKGFYICRDCALEIKAKNEKKRADTISDFMVNM